MPTTQNDGQILFRYYGNLLSLSQASGTSDGYLSSADWSRFNTAATSAVFSVFGRAGTVTALAGDYAAFYPSLTGSYADPGWITSLARSKITPAVEPALGNPSVDGYVLASSAAGLRSWVPMSGGTGGAVSSVFTRTGAVIANTGDYSAFYPQLSGSYANPGWITSLAWSKITGAPAFVTSAEPPLGNPASDGQVLSSTAAGVRSWITPPTGLVTSVFGRTGAIVATANDYSFTQLSGVAATTQGGLPTGGSAGQSLIKSSTTNYAASWGAVTFSSVTGVVSTGQGGLPTGGTAGQTLTKNSGTNYDASWATPGGAGTMQFFGSGSTGTYTPSAGTKVIFVECWGGGGGGGGCSASTAGNGSYGGGGGGGGYASWYGAPGSYSYSVGQGGGGAGGAGGPGGNTTFGGVTAFGGTGGSAGIANGNTYINGGTATGGGATAGNISNLAGSPGLGGWRIPGPYGWGGEGGGAPKWGGAGAMQRANAAGNSGTAYGAGGGGAASSSGSPSAAGGSGFGGLIIVWEFH